MGFEFHNMITRIDSATSKSNGKILGSSQSIRTGIGGFNLAFNDDKRSATGCKERLQRIEGEIPVANREIIPATSKVGGIQSRKVLLGINWIAEYHAYSGF